MESPEGLRDALILLITNGADVYAKNRFGHSVTDIAYNARKKSSYDGESYQKQSDRRRLWDIWREALAACGYDAEEVVRRSLQVAEVSGSDSDMDEDVDDCDIVEGADEDEDGDEDNDSDADVKQGEDDYGISGDENENNDNTRQNDEYITRMQRPELTLNSPNTSVARKTCSFRKESLDDESRRHTASAVYGHFDWSFLEDDTNVWRE